MNENNIVNTEKAKELINSKELVIIDFFATWCGPCQMFIPVFDEYSRQNESVNMVKIDIDKEPEFSSENNVMGVPTIVAYKDGKEVSRFSGFRPMNDLSEFINSVK